jgi:hypothetical protein
MLLLKARILRVTAEYADGICIFGYALLDLVRKLNNLASASGVKKVVLVMAIASTTIQGPDISFSVPFEQIGRGSTYPLKLASLFSVFCGIDLPLMP